MEAKNLENIIKQKINFLIIVIKGQRLNAYNGIIRVAI